MWAFIAKKILRNRLAILIGLGVITAILGYQATFVSITYDFAKLLPDNDTTLINHNNFKKQFGDDGTVMVVGFRDSNLFELKKFNDLYDLTYNVKKIDGIQEVVSVARLYNLTKNDSLMRFEFKPVLTARPQTQSELDSISDVVRKLPFYNGFILNKDSNAYVIAITFDKDKLNSKNRFAITDAIVEKVNAFGAKHKLDIHYSGLPYIRSVIARKIANEMQMFMALAIIVTAVILLVFFRNWQIVLFVMLVVIVGVVWSFGTIYSMGYKITVLSGLIPPLIIVIGVPNCILILNKYHTEYKKHHNKIRAIARSIQTVGVSLFFANVTTSIGFFVFIFTHSKILVEFGLVASMNVMGTYVVSMLMIPIIFSYLPPPKEKHTKHIDSKIITKVLQTIDKWVHIYRPRIYITVIIICIVSAYGMYKVNALGYVVDDLPAKDRVYVDLNFFQKNFHGVLPFEVSIDTKKPGGAMQLGTLYKVNKFQKTISRYEEFSKPLSIVEAVKFSNQAYHEGKPKFYLVPGSLDLAEISKYATEAKEKQSKNQFKNFLDSSRQKLRVSVQMADVGSVRMKELIAELKPKADSIFNYDYDAKKWVAENERYNVVFTGSCVMFLKGNDYLVKNLIESVGIAIVLITLVMLTLFMTFRMVVISAIPSLIPLLITAGLMGYFNIHLKPSTILIYSIAFGIASDGTLYFLTKYRQELKNHNYSISRTVSLTIKETGVSMIYTAIILAAGFSIFTASSFGGTAALGLLVSVTLIFAYCSNLILLPCFLLSLEKYITRKAILQEPLFDIYDEEEDIELKNLKIEGE